MKIASVAEVKTQFSMYLRASESGPVVVTRNGKPVAVLVSVEDDDELERMILAHSSKLKSILESAHRRIEAGQGVPHEAFWQAIEAKKQPERPRAARKKAAR
jgi:prevent-host-death family protein